MKNIVLETKGVTVAYGKHTILKGIDLTIEKHKITAIIGPSGCGKSTLLKSLNRIIDEMDGKVEGTILLEGQNYLDLPIQELRHRVGLVFQSPVVFPFSILKNMTYPLQYYHKSSQEEHTALAKKYLAKAGLYDEVKDMLDLLATKLSGGQQQRLAIARALTVDPHILLLDEPCSALDLKNTLIIEKMLRELREDYTIVIVTHNLAQAKRLADEIVFMENGLVVEVGTPDSIFNHPQITALKEYLAYYGT